MSKKKRKPSRRSNSGARRAPKRTRRRRRALSEGGLADIFTPAGAMEAAKETMSASGGAMGAVFINKMIPTTWGKLVKLAIAFGGGFFGNRFVNPAAGAGFTGGMVALTFQNGFMNEGEASFADPSSLEEMPLYLDENDNPMVLEEGGNFRYLEDSEIQHLAEAGVIELVD